MLSLNEESFKATFEDWRGGIWLGERKTVFGKIESDARNKTRIHGLAELVEAGGMLPFIGAGLSIPSGFKRWGEFLHQLRLDCDPAVTENELNNVMWNQGYEEAAELVISKIAPLLFDERFEAYCRALSLEDVVGCVRFLPLLFNGHGATTNFDNVLELVYGGYHSAFGVTLKGKEIEKWSTAAMHHKTMLLKVHGHATEPATRVLTKAEYDAAYAPGCAQRAAFEQIVRSTAFLFLGCSLGQDRTLDVFHDVYSSATAPNHRNYAILPRPAEPAMMAPRENFLAARGVFPIWYGEHGDKTNPDSPSHPDFDHDLHVETILVEILDRQGRIGELTVTPEEPYRIEKK